MNYYTSKISVTLAKKLKEKGMPMKECGGMTVLHDMRKLILEQCKEWLKENGYLATNGWYTIKGTLADFEADMLKLWEGEK